MREWIIIGGGALIGLIVLHGLFLAWWRGRDPLRMKIQPGLLPEGADDDAWLSAELPNGGARVVTVDSPDADTQDAVDAEEGVPVLLETAGSRYADGAALDPSAADQADEAAASDGSPLPDMAPIVPERGLGSGRRDAPKSSPQAEAERDAASLDLDPGGLSRDEPLLAQAAFEDSDLEAMPEAESRMSEAKTSFEDSHSSAEGDADQSVQEAASDLLAIHLVAPNEGTFSGEALLSALRAQDLRFGEMNIFHRIDDETGEALFSFVRAVEPGSFDLTRIEDCASPGLIAFLRLPSPGDAEEVVEDMIQTAEAMADDLGGELLDDSRKPFTALVAAGYHSRALGFADRGTESGGLA